MTGALFRAAGPAVPGGKTAEAPRWAGGKSNTRLPMRQFRGADRDRTDDLRLAKPALSQLSYSPGLVGRHGSNPASGSFYGKMTFRRVGQGRVELPTSRLS